MDSKMLFPAEDFPTHSSETKSSTEIKSSIERAARILPKKISIVTEAPPVTPSPSSTKQPLLTKNNSADVELEIKNTQSTLINSNVNSRAKTVLVKSIMDDVEQEAKNNGISPKVTPNLALARSMRKNIEIATKTLETAAYRLTAMDWTIFVLAAVCMALISLGIDYHITSSFTLNQLLSALALAAKSAEKTLNLSGVAKAKITQAKNLKTLTQQISTLEFSLYLSPEPDDASFRNKNATAMQAIWTQYNSIELQTFLPPPRPDPAPATNNTTSNTT